MHQSVKHEYALSVDDGTVYKLELSTTEEADPPGADDFYRAIGKALIQWGRLENNIDIALRIILELPESQPIRRKNGSPQQFAEKVKLWRQTFTTLPTLHSARDKALAIILAAEGLERYRTPMVHSLWGNFIPGPPLKLKGLLVSSRKGQHEIRQSVVELVALHEFVEKLRPLIIETVELVHHVNELRKTSVPSQ